MNTLRHTIRLSILLVLAACSEEPPPISVAEFMENPRLLEATMVRCAQNRSESRYIVECVNARDAVNRIEAVEEKKRREEFEKQSERKRQALRRTQEAAAEARRRAVEAQRRRDQENYLGIFDENSGTAGGVPPASDPNGSGTANPVSNAPAVIVEPNPEPEGNGQVLDDDSIAPETDLGAIREELKRRQEINN